MNNFTFQNPTKIIFGKNSISQLKTVLDPGLKILMTYGGGSIKRNGVYDQVIEALRDYSVYEFGGIGPNPEYETCMKAARVVKDEGIDFLLSVGGGSVLDATKFIAASIYYGGEDPWDILTEGAEKTLEKALPIGCVHTLPATGSEMNGNAVISRRARGEKLAFSSPHVYPRFSILDPETTYSLPERQVINGIVDAYIHVLEQYLTYNVNTPLQDRQSEAILMTLIEQAPLVKENPKDYNVRANIMWCATQALNGTTACGAVEDWTTHRIGHEITVLHGLDHAQTLAIILPAVMRYQRGKKKDKILQYAERIWGITASDPEKAIDLAVEKTVSFFNSIGMPTRLRDYELTPDSCMAAADNLARRGNVIGEHKDIGKKEVQEILTLCA